MFSHTKKIDNQYFIYNFSNKNKFILFYYQKVLYLRNQI